MSPSTNGEQRGLPDRSAALRAGECRLATMILNEPWARPLLTDDRGTEGAHAVKRLGGHTELPNINMEWGAKSAEELR